MPYIASIFQKIYVGEEVETASNRAWENIVQSGNSKWISVVMEFSWSSKSCYSLSGDLSVEVWWDLRLIQKSFGKVDSPVGTCIRISQPRYHPAVLKIPNSQ